MSAALRIRPVATRAMLAVWSDATLIAHALAFETALARAQAAEGLIDGDDADAVTRAAGMVALVDPATLAEETAHAGTLAIPLVARLRDAGAAAAHRGATSQDVADTALMRQVRGAAALLSADGDRVLAALDVLARRHGGLPAIGRTLLRDARPIGWGLRVAQWRAGLADAADRLTREVDVHAAIQFGGAAGTRAGLDGRATAISARLAAELGLADGPPWHARRTGVAAIAAAVGILIGALGKMARDVALLGQQGVDEAREPLVAGRGSSSAMPGKHNPAGCQTALAAATRAPGLVAGVLAALPAEEERGLGGWQAEGPMLADLFLLASGALDAMATVAEGMEIDEVAIARNLASADVGADLGESAALIARLLGDA